MNTYTRDERTVRDGNPNDCLDGCPLPRGGKTARRGLGLVFMGDVLVAALAALVGCTGCARTRPIPGESQTLAHVSRYADHEQRDFAFHDAHFHLSNYVQQGTTARDVLEMMGDQVGRTALFGIPLQQKWDYFVSGDRAPDYYLLSDAALYYYSFVDAVIAHEYLGLTPEEQSRFDPMIVGFNPTDMYATNHIREVLRLYPGVFVGIGEFSVHKEFVSAKVTGHTASVRNPALGNILVFASEVGLLTILHCDMDTVRPAGGKPAHLDDMINLLKEHPAAVVIWAHTGLGRFVKPSEDHVDILRGILSDPGLSHVHFDLSWDEIAEYVVRDEDTVEAWAALINRYPDRFLFGSDAVAPRSREDYLSTYRVYEPLWGRLNPGALRKVKIENYERLFDAAIRNVRAWEARQGYRRGVQRYPPDHGGPRGSRS